MKKTFRFQGGTIEYELTRKRVKNLNLRLRADGTLAVSAPYFVSQRRIDDFLSAHIQGILAGLEKQRQHKNSLGTDSHSIFLRGQRRDIVCLVGRRNSAVFDGERVWLTLKDEADVQARKTALDKLIRELAILWVSESSGRIYPIFQKMGVKEPELKFRRMKSRWGSCRYERASLSFNTALAHVPDYCVDYVVMHEYCHFIHPNHSPAFHELMTRLMPDWKARKKVLENYSALL